MNLLIKEKQTFHSIKISERTLDKLNKIKQYIQTESESKTSFNLIILSLLNAYEVSINTD